MIVPCGKKEQNVLSKCYEYEQTLSKAGFRVHGDYREEVKQESKIIYWELIGVPLRIELGPKEVDEKKFVAARRDKKSKQTLDVDEMIDSIKKLLDEIHQSMFKKYAISLLVVCYIVQCL